jgi:hypothetical protein
MFNILNRWIREGKNSPMVCKFLDSVSAFFHGIRGRHGRLFYLLERIGLRNSMFLPVGLRIAFLIERPAFVRIRRGKD